MLIIVAIVIIVIFIIFIPVGGDALFFSFVEVFKGGFLCPLTSVDLIKGLDERTFPSSGGCLARVRVL